MPQICYVPKRFGADALEIIDLANEICDEYAAQGFDLTLRQLYYQFVSRDAIPNSDQSYKRLGSIINDARLAGLLDWDFIVDRTRNLRDLAHWDDPSQIIEAVSRQFRHNKWANQPKRVEVWIEKDALVGVIEGVCTANDVPFFSCRGYTSQSEVWGAGQRLLRYVEAGQMPVIIHLGDHDPSGIDMTRDIRDRLRMFITHPWKEDARTAFMDACEDGVYEGSPEDARAFMEEWTDEHPVPDFRVERIALNMDQVLQYNPPPNPAKLTDARARGYIETHGRSSWELDALNPTTLAALIQAAINRHRNPALWAAAVAAEEQEREVLTAASRRWDEVAELLA